MVAPTPPAGLPKVALPSSLAAAPPPAPSSPGPQAPQPAQRARPSAPVFSFAPSPTAAAPPPPAPSEARARPTSRPSAIARHPSPDAMALLEPGSTCSNCGAQNPAGYRFCVSCGSVVRVITRVPGDAPAHAAPQPEPRAHLASQPEHRAPSEPRAPPPPPLQPRVILSEPAGTSSSDMVVPAASERIVGAPVVSIAAQRREPVSLVACPRCHGQCTSGTRFCKFCGAPLADPPSLARPQVSDSLARQRVAEAPVEGPIRSPLAGYSPAGRDADLPPARPEAPPPASSSPRLGDAPLRPPPPRVDSAPGFGPSAPAPRAVALAKASGKLVVIVEDGSEGARFPLTAPQIDIGRTEGEIRLEDDPYVSPRHARIVAEAGGWVLRDLGSTNGVYVRLRRPHALRDADLLLLGLEVLQFDAVSDGERGLGPAVQHGTRIFGSPATPRHARLRQRTVEGIARDVYHLAREETVIGREIGDIVFTSDPFLSRRHAAIRRHPATGEFTLEDLDSSNGTYVAIRRDVPLASGDFVRIGQHLFRVDLD